jgi:transcription initiation factor TFIID subunit 2
MPGLVETPGGAVAVAPVPPGLGYSVVHQVVTLEVEILRRSLKGKTTITISPHSRELNKIRLNCRQCHLTKININRKAPGMAYANPYDQLEVTYQATVYQYHQIAAKIEPQGRNPPDEELVLTLPRSVRIEEQDVFAQALAVEGSNRRDSTRDPFVLDSALPLKTSDPSTTKFENLDVNIEFTIDHIRDGLQFVGLEDNDGRYPHAYTRNTGLPGGACCLFPCVDSISSRCTWDISIKCHRTLGDAMKRTRILSESQPNQEPINGARKYPPQEEDDYSGLSPEDRELEMTVVCSVDITDEVTASNPDTNQ